MSLERSAATPFWSDPSALRASLLDTYPALESASAAGYFPPRKVLNAPGQRLHDLPRPMGHRIRRPLDLPRPMGHRIRRRLDQLRRKPRLRVARNLQRLRTAAHPLRPMEAAALLIEQLRVVSLKAGQFGRFFFSRPSDPYGISALPGDFTCFHTLSGLRWSPPQLPYRIQSILRRIRMLPCASLGPTIRIKSDFCCDSGSPVAATENRRLSGGWQTSILVQDA